MVALAEGCCQLTDLEIVNRRDNGGITDVSVLKIFESCQQFEALGLSGLPALTDESLHAVEKNCKCLQYLILVELSVSNAGLKTLFASPNLNELRRVVFESLDLFDDTILELVKNNHATLGSLEISKCNNVTDVAMCYISQHCTQLKDLSLCDLPCVSHPIYIAEILRRNLKLVDLSCASLGSQSRIVDEAKKLVPTLQTLLDENKKRLSQS